MKLLTCFLFVFICSVCCKVAVKDKSTKSLNSLEDSKVKELKNDDDQDEETPATDTPKVDNGVALILTPYIEEGRLNEAREDSRVDRSLFFGYESYSGYFTVNKTYNSNSFFWYFPVVKKPVKKTPWVIWLQGGPGASSLTSLFNEIGPYKVTHKGNLLPYPHTWLQNHSLVFIDNPVGTGFSFTDSEDGYVHDMDTYGHHLYLTVKQLVTVYPELQTAPLYVAGESYAGKYVPALAMQLHRHKDDPDFNINLQGLIVGNAYVDPEMISHMARPFYYFGMLEKEEIKAIQPLLTALSEDIAANRSVEAKNRFMGLVSLLLYLSHQTHAYNFLEDRVVLENHEKFLNKPEIRKAIHVGDIIYTYVNITVNLKMAPDFLSSSKALYEELLESYRVLTYCGNLDQMMPCVVTSEHYRTWKWSSSDDFIKAVRNPYMFKNRLAGYHKTGGNLTELIIRGAGHMAPMDTPDQTAYFITQWTHNEPLDQPIGTTIDLKYVEEYVKKLILPTS